MLPQSSFRLEMLQMHNVLRRRRRTKLRRGEGASLPGTGVRVWQGYHQQGRGEPRQQDLHSKLPVLAARQPSFRPSSRLLIGLLLRRLVQRCGKFPPKQTAVFRRRRLCCFKAVFVRQSMIVFEVGCL